MPPRLNKAAGLGVTLRPMGDDDLPFAAAVYASTRTEELEPTGWPDELKQAFLERQHEAQHHHYRSHYPGAEWLIVERGGKALGRLYLVEWTRELRVIDIALLPEARGQGSAAHCSSTSSPLRPRAARPCRPMSSETIRRCGSTIVSASGSPKTKGSICCSNGRPRQPRPNRRPIDQAAIRAAPSATWRRPAPRGGGDRRRQDRFPGTRNGTGRNATVNNRCRFPLAVRSSPCHVALRAESISACMRRARVILGE